MQNLMTFCIFLKAIFLVSCMDTANYLKLRQNLLDTEEKSRLGSDIVLNADEQEVNGYLMKEKIKEINASRYHSAIFPPEENFLSVKHLIEESKVFKLLKLLPKGGVLALHSSAMTNVTWLIQNATYRDHCYMCWTSDNRLKFQFSPVVPSNKGCTWKLVNDERKSFGKRQAFDEKLHNAIVMSQDHFFNESIHQNIIWNEFENYFTAVRGLLIHEPVFLDYIYEGLREFLADNVQYIEMRSSLRKISGLDGVKRGDEYTLKKIIEVAKRFMKDHPDMVGMKIILSQYRLTSKSYIQQRLNLSSHLLNTYPDWFAGFDLVGQEDTNPTFMHYLNELLVPITSHHRVPYFFHAGETDWQGTPVDENLFDAILLNSSRLGHAYALIKHPELLKLVKQQQIAIEVNPICNQMLGLLEDLRNHPAAHLIAEGYPVIVGPNDPAVWQTEGVTYDLYEIFMGIASQHADLRLLKQFAINSIKYSALDDKKKQEVLVKWRQRWDQAIHKIRVMIKKPDIIG